MEKLPLRLRGGNLNLSWGRYEVSEAASITNQISQTYTGIDKYINKTMQLKR